MTLPWSIGHIDQAAAHVVKAASAGYQGPLDIQSGAKVWVGLRAGSAAKRGSAIIKIRRSSDNTIQDITCDAVTGILNTSDVFFNGSPHYEVVTWYDQSGNGYDFAGITSNTPYLVLGAGPDSVAALRFDAAISQKLIASATASPTQPNYVSAVVKTTSIINQGYFGDTVTLGGGGGNNQIGFNGSNTAQLYAGAAFTATATTSSWHAIQSIMNAGSSEMYIDGSSTTGSAGANGMFQYLGIGTDGYGNDFTGDLVELGYWGGVGASNKASMNTNQHTYYGF